MCTQDNITYTHVCTVCVYTRKYNIYACMYSMCVHSRFCVKITQQHHSILFVGTCVYVYTMFCVIIILSQMNITCKISHVYTLCTVRSVLVTRQHNIYIHTSRVCTAVISVNVMCSAVYTNVGTYTSLCTYVQYNQCIFFESNELQYV